MIGQKTMPVIKLPFDKEIYNLCFQTKQIKTLRNKTAEKFPKLPTKLAN